MTAPPLFALDASRWKKSMTTFVLTVVVAIALILGTGWQPLTHKFPLYATVPPGSQAEIGLNKINAVDEIPFWIWVVLPRLFPEKLPGAGGYTALGLTWEQGSELPIGFTKQTRGIPQVVLSDPSNTNFDIQSYYEFLVACAQDPRFNANFILPEITYNINLSLWEKLVYRFSTIPNTKKALLSGE